MTKSLNTIGSALFVLVLVALVRAGKDVGGGGEEGVKKLGSTAAGADVTGRGGGYNSYPHDGWGHSQQYHYSAYPDHHGHHGFGIDLTTGILLFLVFSAVVCYPLYTGYGGFGGHGRSGSGQNGSDTDDWWSSRSQKDLMGMAEKVITAVEKLYKTYGKNLS